MAYKGPIKQKTGINTSEVMHPETEADVVLYSNTIEGVNVDNVKEALDKLATGVGVSGVKGDNEATYRTGYVNLTPANIGAIPSSEKASANGVATLDSNVKVPISQLPDFIVGQMVYGGTVNNSGVATLTVNGKTKLGVTSSTINLPTNPTSVYEGIYFIADNTCNNTTIVGVSGVTVGDWLIVTNLIWKKIDNTDSVSSVNNKTGAVVLNAGDIQYDSTHTIAQQIDAVDNKVKVTNATVGTTGSGNGVSNVTITSGQIVQTKTNFATSSDVANKADKASMTAGTYSAVNVNTQGIVTAGAQVLRVVEAGQIPTDLAINGWYFEKKSATPYNYQVAISFNDTNRTNRSYIRVYDGEDNSGTPIINVENNTTAIPQTMVICQTGYLFVETVTNASEINCDISSVTGTIGVLSDTSTTTIGQLKIKVQSDGGFTVVTDYGTASGYSGTIIPNFQTSADHPANTYFKFDSDYAGPDSYDGYVNRSGVLTGSNTFTNKTRIAIYNGAVDGDIAYIEGITYSANDDVIVVNLTQNGNIEIYGLDGGLG